MEKKKRGRPPKIKLEVINELLAKGLNQREIAEKIGVHQVALSSFLRKRTLVKYFV